LELPSYSIHGINYVGRQRLSPVSIPTPTSARSDGDPSHLSLPRLLKSPLFDKIPQTGIVGDDHMMMWDTNSDEIAGILLKVDRAAHRE
jgi:hypothetical protein